MMFKVVTVLLLALVPLAMADDECLSCDWISPEGTVALFRMNKQMEESAKAGRMVPLENPLKDDMLMSIMTDVVEIMDSQKCNELLAGKLVTMMARLEEGPAPAYKNKEPYVRRPLVKTLEEHFVRMLTMCMAEGQGMAKLAKNNSHIQSTWAIFIKFGEYIKEKLYYYTEAHRSPNAPWFIGGLGMGELPPSSLMTPDGNALMKRAKQIMGFDYLYAKIKPVWGNFFGVDANGGAACQEAITENLINRFGPLSNDLSATFKPLLILANYSPDTYVKVPNEAKVDRPIYEVLKQAKKAMQEDQGLADLILLHQVLRKTLNRTSDFCVRH